MTNESQLQVNYWQGVEGSKYTKYVVLHGDWIRIHILDSIVMLPLCVTESVTNEYYLIILYHS